jgi:hypothetical protein
MAPTHPPPPPPPPQDGGNTNNIITVLPRESDGMEARERILSPAGTITDEERSELVAMLCPWSSHDSQDHWPAVAARAAAEAAAVAEERAAAKARSRALREGSSSRDE